MKVVEYVKTQSKTFGTTFITIYMLIGWAIYVCLYTALERKASTEPLAGYLSLIGETGLDVLAAILTIKLCLTEIKPTKNIFLIFSLSFLAATVADSIYNIVLNLLRFQYINPTIVSLFDIPFALFLLFQLAAWGWILYLNKETTTCIRKSSYAPYVIVSILMFILFMFGIPWRIGYLSTIGIFQTIDTILEVIGFALATICLARAKSQLMRFITIGYLIVVSSDFVIRYFVISGLVPYLNPLESTWVLGMLLMCLGFIFISDKDKKVWFELLPVNSLQPQMAIWLLILWLLSVLIFIGLYYALLPINEHNLNRLIKYLLATLFPLTTIATVSSCYIAIKLSATLFRLENIVSSFMDNDNIEILNLTNSHENYIFEFVALEKFVFDAFALYKQKFDLEINFAKMATQISHDIKSPLVALDIIVTNFPQLPEEKRILARSAMRRINDIANNLLKKNREIMQKNPTHYQNSPWKSDEPKSSQLLLSLIDNIISEKRIQLNTKSKVDISFSVLNDCYGIFVEVQPIEFNRLLSNLINNSIEALGDTGNIKITLNIINSKAEIRVMDNGPGIHPELLLKLGQRGVSHGKFEGNGLGIFHAIASCEAVNGSLNIESNMGDGTSIIITLPISNPPSWFTFQLQLTKETTIFIVDDDSTIKAAWQQRFEQIGVKNHQIEIHYLSTFNELETYLSVLDKQKKIYFLLDYEIPGDIRTGLDVVEQLNIGSQTLLVTSHWHETSLQTSCCKLGVRLLPKKLAAVIPIKLQSALKKFDAVLLDDDQLITSTWTLTALENNKNFISFNEPESFFAALTNIDRSTPVFIDSNLSKNIKGQDLIPRLKALNFEKIFLATGYNPEYFAEIYSLTGVVGKTPPKDIC